MCSQPLIHFDLTIVTPQWAPFYNLLVISGHVMQIADSLEKTLILGKIEGRRKRGRQRMRWLDGPIHQLDRHGFEQALGVGDGQGGLVCCSPWGHKESDMTERLN